MATKAFEVGTGILKKKDIQRAVQAVVERRGSAAARSQAAAKQNEAKTLTIVSKSEFLRKHGESLKKTKQ